jgi:Fe-S cluster assembly protein SufD
MGELLQSLAAGFQGGPQRRALLDAALRDGLPGPRSEAWKYTPLRALERRSFAVADSPAPLVDPALIAAIPAPRLVFVNGCHAPAQDDLAGLPRGVRLRSLADVGTADEVLADTAPEHARADAVFARLNRALARDGVLLEVDAGTHVEPVLHLVFIGAPGNAALAWHLRNRIVLGDGATLVVVEHHLAAGDHANLGTLSGEVALGEGAQLLHARIQDEGASAIAFARTEARLARHADYRRTDLELGAALSRHELDVQLAGDNARLSANGVLLANGRRHIDTRLGIEHLARDTACDLVWRGLGSDRGRAVFHGGITIHAGADGTDATLSNKNLLLSEGAGIDTQPVLVIHADEVQAAHGATVGRLDPTALFYLRSRGLPRDQAQRLLTAAFCREAAQSGDPRVQPLLDTALERALARLEPSL